MCLTTITKIYDKPKKVKSVGGPWKTGWKLVRRYSKWNHEKSRYDYELDQWEEGLTHKKRKFDTWYTDTNTLIIESDHELRSGGCKTYPAGYHICDSYEDALEYNGEYNEKDIYEVRYQDVIAEGTQSTEDGHVKTIIAKQIMVIDPDTKPTLPKAKPIAKTLPVAKTKVATKRKTAKKVVKRKK